MEKNFYVIGTKDEDIKSVSGPHTMEEAVEVEKKRRQSHEDLRFEIRHKRSM